MAGPLSHIRVLDLTRILAGPWAGQNLADLGAAVIKIEKPGEGDDTRRFAPPYLKDPEGRDTSESAYFLGANRGKQSVTVDISKPEGQRIIRELAAQSDVLIENYKVGTLARYGLSYEHLKAENPGLVYCSITGFGQSGPYAQRAGYDFIFQGMGGLMSITGERDGQPGGGPQKMGVAISDILTGLYATVAIVSALAKRAVSGQGDYLDIALLDCQLASLANMNMNYLVAGETPGRMGNAHATIVPYQVFRCKDGHMILAVGNQGQYEKFCRLADCMELVTDPRFATNVERVKNRDVLVPLVEKVLLTRSGKEWSDLLEPEGVPCGPIYNIPQAFDDPQIRHRGMRFEMSHPLNPRVSLVASPMRFVNSPIEYRLPPPMLGQHTERVLADLLGMDAEAISRLAAQRII